MAQIKRQPSHTFATKVGSSKHWRPAGFETPQWQKLYGEKWREERPGTYGSQPSRRPPGWNPEMKRQRREYYQRQMGMSQALIDSGYKGYVVPPQAQQPQTGQPYGYQTQLSYMVQQPQPQLGTFSTPAPQFRGGVGAPIFGYDASQNQWSTRRGGPAPVAPLQPNVPTIQPSGQPMQQQQPKPKYDWQQPQMGIPTPEQRGGEPLLPGQPLPPTAQFGYRQPRAYGYRGRQGLGQPYESQFGGLSQYFNY